VRTADIIRDFSAHEPVPVSSLLPLPIPQPLIIILFYLVISIFILCISLYNVSHTFLSFTFFHLSFLDFIVLPSSSFQWKPVALIRAVFVVMESVSTPVTWVYIYETTRRHIPEDCHSKVQVFLMLISEMDVDGCCAEVSQLMT